MNDVAALPAIAAAPGLVPAVPSALPEVKAEPRAAAPYWNSYAAGTLLGLVLLASFVVTGRGLGASGAVTRVASLALQKGEASLRGGTAAEHATFARRNGYSAQYVNDDADPLDDFLIYMMGGVVVGGFVSGVLARRVSFGTIHGPHTTTARRLVLAAAGGAVSAWGARLARGCTSGQALTGGATLALGSWVFMLAVFAGGYALAWFLRKEWL